MGKIKDHKDQIIVEAYGHVINQVTLSPYLLHNVCQGGMFGFMDSTHKLITTFL